MNNGLFVVVDLKTDLSYTVYDVKVDKNGYPHFLIYKRNEWLWISAKHFRPKNAFD